MRKIENIKGNRSIISGKRIMDRIFEHNFATGGCFTNITGAMGSGKTAALLFFLEGIMLKYPKCKCFFSSAYNVPLQPLRMGMNKNHLMVKKDSGVTFHDRLNKLHNITDTLPITYFRRHDDLWTKAKYDKVNCIFFGDRLKWMQLIHYLRSTGEWCAVFLDELSEIAPANQAGKGYHTVGQFASDLKECRKCMLDVHANTQSIADIDYRILSKVMIDIYMPGSHIRNKRLRQRAIDNLERNKKKGNEAYLLESGEFGKVRFSKFYEPIENLQIEARTDMNEKRNRV